jgi:hypothetical protein
LQKLILGGRSVCRSQAEGNSCNQKIRRAAAFGAQGSGGVGRTIACTITARDPNSEYLINDAILLKQLGNKETAGPVIAQAANIVRATGGHMQAPRIAKNKDSDVDEEQKTARHDL